VQLSTLKPFPPVNLDKVRTEIVGDGLEVVRPISKACDADDDDRVWEVKKSINKK